MYGKLFLLKGALLLCISSYGQKDQTPQFTIYTYGLRSWVQSNPQYTVAKKYGIVYKSVAGCIVSKELVDSVQKHNDEVYHQLEKKYGPGWKASFEKQIDSLERIEKKSYKGARH